MPAEDTSSLSELAKNRENWNPVFFERIYSSDCNQWPAIQKAITPEDYKALSEAFTEWKYEKYPGMKPEKEKPIGSIVSVADIEEAVPEWLISGYVPRYQLTIIAGDGGVGKSTMACAIAAAVSAGKHSFLVPLIEQRVQDSSNPGKVIYLSSEDSFSYTLRRRLELYGADLKNILTVPVSDQYFSSLKLGSEELENMIKTKRPALLILDPLQSFIPPEINMGARNAMRDCLNNVLLYGEKYGVTTIILCHTNKRVNAWGRDRIADSGDLWDISRSVLMSDFVNGGKGRYLSHEKSNYSQRQDTILFELKGELITITGYTDKDDKYFQTMKQRSAGTVAPARDEAEEIIMDMISDTEMQMSSLDESVKNAGVSPTALRRAKQHLKESGSIRIYSRGGGKTKQWFVRAADKPESKVVK